MAQNDKNKNFPAPSVNQPPLDQETIKAIIDNSRAEIQVQKLEKEIRLRELDHNSKLAEKSLEAQERILTVKGKNFKTTLLIFGGIGVLLLIILLGFLVYCLSTGKDQFAYKFAGGIFYLLSTIVAYYFGRKSNNKKDKADLPEQEF